MNPSILFTAIPSPAQAAAIAKQMKSMGFQVQMMGGDGMKDKTELITNAGRRDRRHVCYEPRPHAGDGA